MGNIKLQKLALMPWRYINHLNKIQAVIKLTNSAEEHNQSENFDKGT
jgi:hypothetical protein